MLHYWLHPGSCQVCYLSDFQQRILIFLSAHHAQLIQQFRNYTVFISGQCTPCCMMPCWRCTVCSSRKLVPTARSHNPDDRMHTVTYIETSNTYIYGLQVCRKTWLSASTRQIKMLHCFISLTVSKLHVGDQVSFLEQSHHPTMERLICCIRSEVLMVVNFMTHVSGMW